MHIIAQYTGKNTTVTP